MRTGYGSPAMAAPAFSVIVPAYNAARTLPATLASIAAQTDTDYEVVVVDDGSSDDTAALAERLLTQGHVHSQANRGLPGARNAGIGRAQGRWVALLDADDLWLPDYLARMRRLLEGGGEDVGVAYCDAWVYDERLGRIGRRGALERYRPAHIPVDARGQYLTLLDENFLWVSACAPRAVIEDVGGFDERLRASEDWNMWMRITATGRRVVGTTDRLGLYRHSEGQMHADVGRMLTGQRDAVRSVLERAELDDELRTATEKRLARSERLVETGVPDPPWRRALRPVAQPLLRLKEFRLRPPAEVRGTMQLLG